MISFLFLLQRFKILAEIVKEAARKHRFFLSDFSCSTFLQLFDSSSWLCSD